ncbi:MAG: hypothetical protein JSS79_16045 [Bacteroidetes bacterium]|nr:hypothetical protein [Bacteroidota bacterium]
MRVERGTNQVLILLLVVVMAACSGSKKEETISEDASDPSTASVETPIPFAHIDSLFVVNNNTFRVTVSQFDVSEQPEFKTDSSAHPVYLSWVEVRDANRQLLLSDSLYRDSWGYPGKTASIKSYQLYFPVIRVEDNAIVFRFNLYDEKNEEGVWGVITYDVVKRKSDYSWVENFSVMNE